MTHTHDPSRRYDLSNDPSEINNLYEDDAYADIVTEIEAAFCEAYTPDNFVDSSYIGTTNDWGPPAALNDGYLTSWVDGDVASAGPYTRETDWTSKWFCD